MQKFIVMSADALVKEDLKILEKMPNYRKYVRGGACTESMLSVYPTVTYAAHTAMATGCVPGKTGITGNFEKIEPATFEHPWVLDHKFVKVPDIFTAAKRAGLTTASVFWPVTGNHPDVDYLINEWPGCAPDIPIAEALKTQGSSEEMCEIARMYAGEMRRSGDHPGCDYFIADCAAEIIRRHAPDLIMIHPANVDGARHSSGVFSEDAEIAVRETDDMIGIVCRAMEAAGYGKELNFLLVSDHGQLNVERILNVNALFTDLGWITLNDKGGISDWKVWAMSHGMCACIILKDPEDTVFKGQVEKKLRELCAEGVYGIGDVLNEQEARDRYGYWGNFSFVIDSGPNGLTAFGESCRHPLVSLMHNLSDYRHGHASHGYLPEKGPQPVFCAKGPAFKENYVGKAGRIFDLAPTLAAAMGIEFFDCDGEARTDLLRADRK